MVVVSVTVHHARVTVKPKKPAAGFARHAGMNERTNTQNNQTGSQRAFPFVRDSRNDLFPALSVRVGDFRRGCFKHL